MLRACISFSNTVSSSVKVYNHDVWVCPELSISNNSGTILVMCVIYIPFRRSKKKYSIITAVLVKKEEMYMLNLYW